MSRKESPSKRRDKRQVPDGKLLENLSLGQVVDFLPDPTLAIDLEGRIIVWNRAMEELTDIPAAEMLGRGDYEYALPFYGTRRPMLIDLALGEDGEIEQKYTFVERKSDALLAETASVMHGRKVYLWGKASPIFDAGGQVIGAIESIRDITDRKLTEEGLRGSEVRFRNIFENVSDFLYVHDLEGRFLESNLIYKDQYGYTGEDFKNLSLDDLIPEEERPHLKEIRGRILERGTDEGVLTIRTKQGGLRTVEYRDSLVRDASGNPVSVRGSARDITERVRAERELRASEQRYRLLAENVRDVIWVLSLDLKYIYVSPSVEKLRGYTPEETMGQPLEQILMPESYTEVLEVLARELNLEMQGFRHDPFWSISLELRMLCKDRPPIWAEVTASFLRDPEGTPTHVLGVTRDITKRKMAEERLRESEKRFRSLFEYSADAHLLIMGNRFVDCNQAALDMLRMGSKDQLLNLHPGKLSPGTQPDGRPSAEKAEALLAEVLDKGSQRFEWVHERADGTVFPAEVVLTAIPWGEERVIYTTWRDISGQKKAEEERRVYEARLMRSQKLEAIGTLAGGIAHDFNNILSAIIGYTELALDDVGKDGPAHRCLQEVLKGGDRAKDLVSQILTFSRQIQSEKKVVQVQVILKEALKLLRSSIPSTIGIVQHIEPGAHAVLADPTQIHQVVMNLCTNAYQAMADTGGTMTVSLAREEVGASSNGDSTPLMPGRYVRLVVEDTGCGMGQEIMNRIFEPFFTTKEKGHGTGLGLSTVHGIVADLSGSISAASRPGSGTTFEVHLPACTDTVREKASIAESLPLGYGERILMVDDETAILEFMKNMLDGMGYPVTSTASSREALALFSSSPREFDLVITDQTMPGLTGIQLCREILAIRGDMPIILMTGYSENVSPETAGELGIRVFLDKPFTRRTVAAAIRKVLDKAGN